MTIPTQRQRLTDTDDMTLVLRTQEGDRAAFGELYERHHVEVFRFINNRCGNRALAQDLAGDVWEKALRNVNGITYGSPIAWLLTTARNRLIDYFRSGRSRLEIIDSDTATQDRPDWSSLSAEDLAMTADTVRTVQAAVRCLTDKQQQAIALTYFDGMTSDQAGEVMGIDGGAVKGLTLRGRHALAKTLQPREA